ncbi:Splicing factor 3A subunit 1 [Ophiocordyceps camponoti-floridani]|uniref:Splicing factor 3A subunit 1 n=1 Tax=Ophiocordyceps camponoti-floridani TaxID=2030778 RepID=A0A8H4Q7C8_9HYPO|nr:Splicing factor 3A subunit 1 [Ophiocordyceps camponoti-floridani]
MAAAPTANGDASAALDNFQPPPNVVLPPREIRTVLEKTAGYVARNGAVFEDRIRDKESRNPKFSFLYPSDAYYNFYQWRLSEIKAGRGTDIAAGRAGEVPKPEKPKGPPAPPELHYSAKMPRINQKDMDVLKLTAQFTAKFGRQWMTQLAQREAGNPQFQFLIPNHTFHNFFQHVVEQYSKVLKHHETSKLREEMLSEARSNLAKQYRVLDRAKQRAEYAKYQETEKQKREEEETKKKEDFARVDWSDFVVVETITFTDADETANLPPPTSLSELEYASLEDRNKASISANFRIEEAMPGEDMETHQQPAHTLPPRPVSTPQQTAPDNQPAQFPVPEQKSAERLAMEAEEARRIQERAEAQARMQQAQAEARGGAGPMKIKENYVPRAAQRAASKVQMALCPNCKQQIPMNELDEHMRIELLDPSWKEQKAKADSRYAHSNISHADVANNLKRLASQRSDVFDPITGQAVSEDELARRKKTALPSFDGSPEAKSQMQSFNVEEQIKAIHQKFADKK